MKLGGNMKLYVVDIEGYKWLTSTPSELSTCPAKYVLVHVYDEEAKEWRVYMFPKSLIDP
jgi:hypothetical protein